MSSATTEEGGTRGTRLPLAPSDASLCPPPPTQANSASLPPPPADHRERRRKWGKKMAITGACLLGLALFCLIGLLEGLAHGGPPIDQSVSALLVYGIPGAALVVAGLLLRHHSGPSRDAGLASSAHETTKTAAVGDWLGRGGGSRRAQVPLDPAARRSRRMPAWSLAAGIFFFVGPYLWLLVVAAWPQSAISVVLGVPLMILTMAAPVAAIILARKARREAHVPTQRESRGPGYATVPRSRMATPGLVLGIIGLAVIVFSVVLGVFSELGGGL
jgi:hypothetical protein